ncbi:hypothetical protein GOM44_01985 [Wolbachia endosymbiont of Atemnus politus]|uniref:hypothetical protein n=1 Tax=Wolbachia endosymbiont of Atemnus politus TaxID=2682840 RepID=UPI0015734287|nr:hypothetical protein [Wolbachia endosymbiont of Atemnus politus]NSX83242.1 hypothetical protein [Wolbachia endosymbiont of Atemnus politus]
MALTDYKYKKRDGFFSAISKGYQQADDHWGIPGAASGLGQYIINNKLKIAGVVLVLSAAALTATYFMNPAYAAFIDTAGAKVATFVGPAIARLSAFAVAHPLAASLIIAVSVVALMAAPVLAYKNSNKADIIEEACELLEGEKPENNLDKLKEILGVSQRKEKAPSVA